MDSYKGKRTIYLNCIKNEYEYLTSAFKKAGENGLAFPISHCYLRCSSVSFKLDQDSITY